VLGGEDDEAVPGVGFTSDHQKRLRVRILRNGTVISERGVGALFMTEFELDDVGFPGFGQDYILTDTDISNSFVYVDEPGLGSHTYTVEVKNKAAKGGADNRKTVSVLVDRSMFITEIDN